MSASITPPANTSVWLPAGSPLVYTVAAADLPGSSPMVIVGIYVNDENVTTLKYPEKLEGVKIDIHDVVLNYLEPQFINTIDNYLTGSTSMWAKVGVTVREQYVNSQGETITTPEGLPMNNYVWLGAAPWNEDPATYIQNFELTNDYPAKPMGPKATYTGEWTVDAMFPWVNRTQHRIGQALLDNAYTTKDVTKLTATYPTIGNRALIYMIVYVENNGRLTKKAVLQMNTTTLPNNKFTSIPLGVNELNNIEWTSTLGIRSSLIEDTDTRYVVYLTAVTPTDNFREMEIPMSQPIVIELDRCQKDEYRILYYSNEGGWWQIRAHKKHYKELSIKTNTMTNMFYQVPTPSMRYKNPTSVVATEAFTLNTDWMDHQWQIDEIEDMLTSTDIYILHNDKYIPVVLAENSYVISDLNQDDLVQYEFTFTAAYNKPTLI